MKKLLLFLGLFFFVSWTAFAQIQDPIHFKVTQKALPDNQLEVLFTASIDAGWHVYSTGLPEGGPISASLKTDKKDGVKLLGKLVAKGKEISDFDKMFQMDVRYFEHQVTFVQKFAVISSTYHVSGYLQYGACNNTSCLPPTNVDFKFDGRAADIAVNRSKNKLSDSTLVDTASHISLISHEKAETGDLWKPVINQLHQLGEENQGADAHNYIYIFFMGLLGGLLALFTPCVWPIIPMTVSFFLKRSKNKARGIRDAWIYGVAIVVIYVSLGLAVTLIFGASALNSLSTNAVFNIFFFLMLLVFAASFFGAFEITLPSSWSNGVNNKAEKTGGLLSIFLMAFTLTLVSFSCTGPIIGFLLVEVSTSGSVVAPAVGMLGFAIALALPFTLFALFPTWLKQMPKSGNWMNNIKVVLGFIELAFSLKFFSVADLAYGWHILDRETFLSLWIIIFALLGAYLMGWFRFPHDEEEYDDQGNVVAHAKTSVIKFFSALISFSFALYMIPGLWGAPCKAVSAFAPPMKTQDFNLYTNDVKAQYYDYEEGMEAARKAGKPVMLDFTGYGCVNCRKMEAAVWTDSQVADLLRNRYVLITLYVDEKTALPSPIHITENGSQRILRTVGDKWSYLQRSKFGANAQPFYVLIDNDGNPLNKSYSYDEDVNKYVSFLKKGLANYHQTNP